MQVTHSRTADAAKSPLPHVNDPVGVIKSVGPQVDCLQCTLLMSAAARAAFTSAISEDICTTAEGVAADVRCQGMLSCCACVEGLVASLNSHVTQRRQAEPTWLPLHR